MQEQEINGEIFDTLQTERKVAPSKVSNVSKNDQEPNGSEESQKETFTITRQRSSCPNILETERNMLNTIQDNCNHKKTGLCICKSNY